MELYNPTMEEFAEEVRDALKNVESGLLALEKGEGDALKLVKDVCRLFHRIKDSSEFLGVAAVSKLANSAEDVLSMMHTAKSLADPRFIIPLFLVVETIRAIVDDLEHSSEMDISPLMNQLETLLRKDISAKGQSDPD